MLADAAPPSCVRDGSGFDADDLTLAMHGHTSEQPVGGSREVWTWLHPDPLGTVSHASDAVGVGDLWAVDDF